VCADCKLAAGVTSSYFAAASESLVAGLWLRLGLPLTAQSRIGENAVADVVQKPGV
jgi:hypothetical protein